MLDYLIRGGTVVDGTGAPARSADVGFEQGRVVAVGKITDRAAKVVDAEGLMVCPGFIDPHTHYDAQLYWDGRATPSSGHGVTTVIGGNCGFTLAPLKAADADYTRRMMAQVEGMPLAALENGIRWTWETFAEYLDGLEGRVAVNAGFLVGHCALRRYVMGEAAGQRTATAAELDELVSLLHESLRAGGLGLSTTRSSNHPDHNGNPVPSRLAAEDELLTLCGVVGEHEGTTLEAIVEGCNGAFDDGEVELLAMMSSRANRPLNWNVLAAGASDQDRLEHQFLPSSRAREVGGRVLALTMPVFAEMNLSLGTYCVLWLIPGWGDVLALPLDEKAARLRDPSVRADLLASAKVSRFARLADFGAYRIGDAIAPQNKPFEHRLVEDIARERGQDSFQCLLEIATADEFRTVLWPPVTADTAADWEVRRALWERPDVLVGGSDAGAHLDRMLGSPYPARFLADTLRGRKLVSVERAVQLLTDRPARLFGFRDRGRLVEGAWGDVVVFDPEAIDSGPVRRAYDLPADSLRLTADAIGIKRVLVNGTEIVVDGVPTAALPGRVLRSGRDTASVATRVASVA